jgi:hypothetical protein
MNRTGSLSLAAAAILFAVYFANVALGAFARAAFLSEIHEMLMLSASVLAFVHGILRREATQAKRAASRD